MRAAIVGPARRMDYFSIGCHGTHGKVGSRAIATSTFMDPISLWRGENFTMQQVDALGGVAASCLGRVGKG